MIEDIKAFALGVAFALAVIVTGGTFLLGMLVWHAWRNPSITEGRR